jgi:D-alanine-D-alanine ligase
MIQDLQAIADQIDLVFNLCDEGFNNQATKELHILSLLEILDLPYTGGTPKCLAYCYDKCYDKSLVRGIIAQSMDIPVPQALMVRSEDISIVESAIDFSVIVKPNFGDSSIGITQDSVCHDLEMLRKAMLQIRVKIADISYVQMLGNILQAGEKRIAANSTKYSY